MKLPDGYVAGQGVLKPTGYGGFGERMLRTMGWDKGQGLGKEKQGMKEAIEVKKKEDTVGVGGVARWNWDDKWWERAFDSAAQTVDKDSSDSSDSDSDDDGIDAAHIAAAISGGTPVASVMNRDGTATTASRDELKLLNALTSSKSRIAAGRFGGRDAKMERIRAQEAKMAAGAAEKLGAPSPATTATTAGDKKLDKASKKKKKKESASDESESDSDAAEAGPSSPVLPVTKERIVIEPQGLYTTDGPTNWNFTPTPQDGWWGSTMFTSAGCLDGMKKDIKPSIRAEFTEDQQEKLYHAAHAGKTQGKVGLGQRSGPVKIGGVKWSGKKVAFEEEEDVTGNTSGSNSSDEDEDEKSKKKRKRKAAELKAVGSSTGLAELEKKKKRKKKEEKEKEVSLSSIKWKKVLTSILKSAPGGELKLKALHSAVTATVVQKLGETGSMTISTEHILVHVESTIASSSKFIVKGKKVKLSS